MITLKQWMIDNFDKTPDDCKDYVKKFIEVEENVSDMVFVPRWDEWMQNASAQYGEDLDALNDGNVMYGNGMTVAFQEFATSKVADQLGYQCSPKHMELCELNPLVVVEEFMQAISWAEIDSSPVTVAEHDAWVDSLK